MKRHAIKQLQDWQRSSERKPLIVLGARQVGKTFLIMEFGKYCFEQVHAINFELNPEISRVFEQNLDPKRLIKELSFVLGHSIDVQKDLLFLDEIQVSPAALTSLKHFREQLPQLAVCCAGSRLGLHLNDGSFPVGSVDFLKLYPMSFAEYLEARAPAQVVCAYTEALSSGDLPIMAHDPLLNFYREYLIVGGLPEVVSHFIKRSGSLFEACQDARKRQAILITSYLSDIAKHCGRTNAMHIERVWQSVAIQLAAAHDLSTNRFKFKDVVPGIHNYGRLASAIDWLTKAGLVVRVPICERAELPLKAYTKENTFKLFMMDVGLLGAFLSLPPEAILRYDYGTFKGYFSENFVAQELLQSNPNEPFYSWSEGKSEVEFLLQNADGGIPVEVKSGQRVRAQSLRVFNEKYKPQTSIVVSAKPLMERRLSDRREVNLPLYLAAKAWGYV